MTGPTTGELFERRYEIEGFIIELLAEVEIEGTAIHLRDLAVFPTGAEQARPGAAAVIATLRTELLPELRSFGFSAVRITATRLTGARVGRSVDLVIRLTEGS